MRRLPARCLAEVVAACDACARLVSLPCTTSRDHEDSTLGVGERVVTGLYEALSLECATRERVLGGARFAQRVEYAFGIMDRFSENQTYWKRTGFAKNL